MEILVNKVARDIRSSPDTPLLWVLRDELGLTGTKYACGKGACGACTVHLDGMAVPSCAIPVGQVDGLAVTTIEGVSSGDALSIVQQVWLEEGVSQCGYCQPGFIMALTALLAQTPRPAEDEIVAAINNLCRCGTYPAMRRAIRRVLAR